MRRSTAGMAFALGIVVLGCESQPLGPAEAFEETVVPRTLAEVPRAFARAFCGALQVCCRDIAS